MSGPMKPRNELNIGLSLSGGGVRAVGFHLGTLDILERLDLLKQVSLLSTVSGGSLVGIGYSLYLKIGAQLSPPKTFKQFYKDFFDFLPKLDTMVELIDGIDVPSESGHRTMVGAMARIYRDHYFEPCYGDPKFEVFWDPALPDIHLKDMMFHASDFKTGLAFRFQYNDSEKNNPANKNIGNRQVYLKPDHAKELYMADIMTTSACLPGLLEPMFMPQDYRLTPVVRNQIRDHFKNECFVQVDEGFNYIALMDGGMLDNQGVSSILLALLSAQAGPPPRPPSGPAPVSPWDYSVDWHVAIRNSRWSRDPGMAGVWDDSGDAVDLPPVSSPPPLPGVAELEQALGDLDLLAISDTPTYKPPESRFYPKKSPFGLFSGFVGFLMNRRLNFYFLVWLVLFLAGVISLALVVWGLISVVLAAPAGTGPVQAILDAIAASNFPAPLRIGLIAMVFVAIPIMFIHLGLWALAWVLARKAEDRLTALFPSREETDRPSLWHYVKGLRVREVWLMLKLRLLSAVRLLSAIFLNRVRQLNYRWVLEVEELESRVIPNEIFKLKVLSVTAGMTSMTPRGPHPLPGWLTSSTADIDDIVEKASSMPTQIYLDHKDVPGERAEDNLAALAACGNLTTCFNIIEHLWQVHGNGDTSNEGDNAFPGDNAARDLFIEARDIWKQLKADPVFYVNDRLA